MSLLSPTILLGPALVVLAVYALCTRFGLPRGTALLAGAAGGLLPVMTLLQLEGWLSQCLATPLLLYGVVALDNLMEKPGLGPLAAVAVLFGGMISIFPEFILLLAGVVGLLLVLNVPRPAPAWKLAGLGVLVLLAPFALNPAFARMALYIQEQRVVTNREIHQVATHAAYPWAKEAEGLNRLWFGDLFPYPEGGTHTLVHGAAIVLVLLAFAGLVGAALRQRAAGRALWSDPERRRPLAFALTTLGLAASPLLLLLRDWVMGTDQPYPFYKSLLSLFPLLVVGLALLGRFVGAALLAAVLLVGLTATVQMTRATTIAGPFSEAERAAWTGWDRYPGRVLHTEDVRQLRNYLEGLEPSNLLIAGPDSYHSSWLSYFARRHRVWLGNPKLTGGIDGGFCDLATKPEAAALVDLSELPDDLLVLSVRKGTGIDMSLPPWSEVLWENATYQVWQPPPGAWVFPLKLEAPADLEEGELFCLLDAPATLDVVASRPGTLTVQAVFYPDPDRPDDPPRPLRVTATGGFEAEWAPQAGVASLALPVAAGRTSITLAPAEPAPRVRRPDGTDSPPILGMQGLQVRYAPAPRKR